MGMNNSFIATVRPGHIINLRPEILQLTPQEKEKAVLKLVHQFNRRDILKT
jgi:uroporphyrinogen-III decarboxylase